MKPLRIAVLSYTVTGADMRVRRSAETLARAGHAVTTIGYGPAPSGLHAHVELPQPTDEAERAAFLLTQFPANLLPAAAPGLHMLRQNQRRARAELIRLAPDAIHAHDWNALPAAIAAKRKTGAKVVYDSHEFAPEEHADNLIWRIVSQRSTQETERRLIRHADAVITIGEGVARALQARYGLPVLPSVILNAPHFRDVDPAPPSHPRLLLFHGVLKRGRGIEQAIGAMPHLPGHRLIIRGAGAPAYVDGLKALAAATGAGDRIAFEPAVRHDDVIPAAAQTHIGLFCAPMDTEHNRLAMPNKFFEYAMAGLALVASEGSDLACFAQKLGCGIASRCDPQALADTIGGLDDAALAGLRANARAAARILSWESQGEALLALYERMFRVSKKRGETG